MCWGLSGFFVFILLFAMSWDTLEPTEYGLVQNGFTGYVDLNPNNVYEGGRYFIWLRHYFLIFPRNLRSLEFDVGGYRAPIPARTGCAMAPAIITPRGPRARESELHARRSATRPQVLSF